MVDLLHDAGVCGVDSVFGCWLVDDVALRPPSSSEQKEKSQA
jgi:hypothetical protein